jgi:hypothetical protein
VLEKVIAALAVARDGSPEAQRAAAAAIVPLLDDSGVQAAYGRTLRAVMDMLG